MDKEIISTYNAESDTLIAQYESKTFEEVHHFALDFIPKDRIQVLDVGSGSGRDAAWFAAKGHSVLAVDPAVELLSKAQSLHSSSGIRWLVDSLPELPVVRSLDEVFHLVWLSAVWMHLPSTARQEAFTHLVSLLKPKGLMMISLRHGEPPKNRKVFQVSVEELRQLCAGTGMKVLGVQDADDTYERDGVWWQAVMLECR